MASLGEASLDRRLVLAASGSEASQEFVFIGGENEYAEGVGGAGPDLNRTLDIDIQDHQPAFSEPIFDGISRGSVRGATEYLCELEKTILVNPALKCGLVEKEVVDAIGFVARAVAGGRGDAKNSVKTVPESGIKESGGSEGDVAGGPDDAPGSGELGGSLEVGGKGGTMTESYRGVEGLSGVSTGHPQASGRF